MQTGQTCERDGDVKLGGAADQGGHDRGGERGDQGHAGKRHTPTAKDFQVLNMLDFPSFSTFALAI